MLPEDEWIIDRRVDVWFCGNLAGWKPTRTADLFNAKWGTREPGSQHKPITRQQASNVIADLKRDLPRDLLRQW